ncbi:two-component regulator propeller domain-containing protein, partial [Seonamhaeicola sp.]|uniref:ligand-binding sensor domain-containing protein n=1 Tax=Seonamhaeicola sp. TaxID=1912245 RepID=UPI003562DA30
MNWIKIIFLFFTCIVFSQKSKQIAFRELTVEHGLSQNSVVSIAQDSTGFMWFATQDGLNKYDGNQFKYYPFQFEDVTRSTYSKLGKIYIDRQDNVWIVVNSGILYKLNKLSDKFELVKNIQNVSTIIQDTNNNYFIGTYGSGLYHFNDKEHDTTQILKENEKDVTTYDFLESEDEIIGATSKGIIKVFSKSNYEFISVFPKTNFSALAKLKKSKQLFLGSFGNGLFVAKDSTTLSFKQFTGFKNASLPTNLIIQDILVNDDKLWVATYGDGAFLVNFNEETVHHFTANKTNPYALHYNDVLSLYEDFTG